MVDCGDADAMVTGNIRHYAASIESLKKAIELKPDYAEAFNNLGTALKDQGKLNEAFENYNKALNINRAF